jgi:hypothetical protein
LLKVNAVTCEGVHRLRKFYDGHWSMTSIMRETMGTDVKRGFDRLFIVLVAVWAAYCLVIFPRQQIKEAAVQYGNFVEMCDANMQDSGRAKCLKDAEQIFRASAAQWTYKNFFVEAWWALILAIIVFPLVVYGCCRGVAAVGLWVWRGFRATPVP